MSGHDLPGGGPVGGGPGGGGLGREGSFGDAESRRRRLQDIQDVAGALRQPVRAPDLTAAILARVEQERPFVSPATRRLVMFSRLGFAASLAVAALGIAMLHRSAPELVTWTYQPQPVSDVVQTAASEASARLQTLRGTLSSVGTSVGSSMESSVITLASAERSAPAAGERATGGQGVAVAQLAPLPPAYGATYVSLSSPQRTVQREVRVEPGPVVVSTVRLVSGLAPRPLAAESIPSAMPWGGNLSTAPLASTSIPVMLEPGVLRFGVWQRGPGADRFLMGAKREGAPGATIDPRVLDALRPAGEGLGSGELAVPR